MDVTSRIPRALRLLHTESSMAWGGQEVRILTEAEGFLIRSHDVRLLVCPGAPIADAAKKRGIPFETLAIGQRNPVALRRMRRWLGDRGTGFDVINTHSSTDSWLTALGRVGLPHAPPIVRTRHVSTPVNRRWSTHWLYRSATSYIVTTGEALRRQLHVDNGIPLDAMTSVPTGIDLAKFRPRNRRAARAALGVEDRPTLGILATLRSWKGHDDLLKAFALLRERFPQWRLLIVGDGRQRGHLQASCRTSGLDDAVRFVGNVDDPEAWLPAFDVFVLPSYGDEGVPQGIMQAMACAIPVVSTTVGAIREAVVDEETGVIVPPRQPFVLAECLARLMSSAPLRDEMGCAGLARAQQAFGLDAMIDRMELVFDRIRSQDGRSSQ